MGGVRSDIDGRTTMRRLYAVGETCCNGVHGANRLASNSLLESLLFAERAADDMKNNYSAADTEKQKAALELLRAEDYSDPAALLESYKKILHDAIGEARKNGCNNA